MKISDRIVRNIVVEIVRAAFEHGLSKQEAESFLDAIYKEVKDEMSEADSAAKYTSEPSEYDDSVTTYWAQKSMGKTGIVSWIVVGSVDGNPPTEMVDSWFINKKDAEEVAKKMAAGEYEEATANVESEVSAILSGKNIRKVLA